MTHENVYFANGNYERRSSKLAMKMPTAELYLKEATVIYGLLPTYSKIARTNVEFVKARLLALVQLPEHGSKLSTER